MQKLWLRGTLICGTLDMLYAIVTTILRGGTAMAVMQSVAAGPFGDGVKAMGWGGALLGLATHFAIMAVMVAVFLFVLWRLDWVRQRPLVAGVAYGVLPYEVMYSVVLALRYPAIFPQTDPAKIAIALFPHIFFVGIPLAFMARRATVSHEGG